MKDELYNSGEYLENNPTWHEEDSEWKAIKVKSILDKNRISYKTLAEVGCGVGEILVQIQKRESSDKSFFGFDISKVAIDVASKKENNSLKYYNTDIVNTNLTFDVLSIMDVIEHVPDYLGFCHRIGKLSEYHVFHIPLDITVQKVLRPKVLQYAREKVGHLHYFTKETALSTLEFSGFKIIDWEYTFWSLELPQNSILKKLMYIPISIMKVLSKDLGVRLFGGASVMVLCKYEK